MHANNINKSGLVLRTIRHAAGSAKAVAVVN
jgi:hypothetical protein